MIEVICQKISGVSLSKCQKNIRSIVVKMSKEYPKLAVMHNMSIVKTAGLRMRAVIRKMHGNYCV